MGYKYFTEEEDAIIRENYPKMRKDICKLFPERSAGSVLARAKKLGLRTGGKETKWTTEEDQILKDNYPTMGDKVKTLLPHRSANAIAVRVSKLHLNTVSSWTREEDSILREANLAYSDDLLFKLPDRKKKDIERRISYLQKKASKNVEYPLNVFIRIYGTYNGYDNVYSYFEDRLQSIYTELANNPKYPEMGSKVSSVLIMYFKEHMDLGDIAFEMKISDKEVKDLLTRGIIILKRILLKKKPEGV